MAKVCLADNGYVRLSLDTVTYGPPKNATVKYGGIVGAALDELGNQLQDQAAQYINLRLDSGILSQTEASHELGAAVWTPYGQVDGDSGGLRWFERLPVSKGGLPFHTIVVIGPSKDFVDTGVFKLDNKFGFKLKDQEFDGANLGVEASGDPWSRVGDPLIRDWSMKFRPSCSFNAKTLINYVGAGVLFDYTKSFLGRRRKLLEVGVMGKYTLDTGYEVSFSLELPFDE